jgi:hypothetical protein
MPFFLIGAFFAIGISLLLFGMIWDCAFTSKMRIWQKAEWLLLLIPTGIGAWGLLLLHIPETSNRYCRVSGYWSDPGRPRGASWHGDLLPRQIFTDISRSVAPE